MNGELAQLVALAGHGNAYLAGVENVAAFANAGRWWLADGRRSQR